MHMVSYRRGYAIHCILERFYTYLRAEALLSPVSDERLAELIGESAGTYMKLSVSWLSPAPAPRLRWREWTHPQTESTGFVVATPFRPLRGVSG